MAIGRSALGLLGSKSGPRFGAHSTASLHPRGVPRRINATSPLRIQYLFEAARQGKAPRSPSGLQDLCKSTLWRTLLRSCFVSEYDSVQRISAQDLSLENTEKASGPQQQQPLTFKVAASRGQSDPTQPQIAWACFQMREHFGDRSTLSKIVSRHSGSHPTQRPHNGRTFRDGDPTSAREKLLGMLAWNAS